MNEKEWLRMLNPAALLRYYRDRTELANDRKLRLLVAASWVRDTERYQDGLGQRLAEIQLRVADTQSDCSELAEAIVPYMPREEESYDLTTPTDASVEFASNPWGTAWTAAYDAVRPADAKRFSQTVRDIFGNPFRAVAFDPKWRTEAAVGLALRMYDDRDFAAMPILADALEEAGCEDADILAHCREPGVHVRGCWVVDLVLGKA